MKPNADLSAQVGAGVLAVGAGVFAVVAEGLAGAIDAAPAGVASLPGLTDATRSAWDAAVAGGSGGAAHESESANA